MAAVSDVRRGRVEGKIAIVTGAASGIGKATARLLASEGAGVVVADINEAGGRAVAEEIGTSAIFLPLDVTDEEQWKGVIAETVSTLGGLNILVNNAGIAPGNTIETVDMDDWRRIHAVCLDSVAMGCKHAIPAIAESGGGSIVNVSSIAGVIGADRLAAYSSAKAGVRHLTKSIALHCARMKNGIRCNSVHPASVDTPILDPDREKYGPRAIEARERLIPMGRIGRPEEVAYAILFLASDESSFTTGGELYVDGGLAAK